MAPVMLAAEAVEATEAPTGCGAFDVLCQSELPLAGDRIREMFLTMAAGVLEWVAAWWAEVPSLTVTDGGFGSQIRASAVALSLGVLVLGLVVQGGRMIWLRRAAPLVDAVTGVSTYVLVIAMAVPLAGGALLAGDVFAASLLADGVDEQVAARVVAELAATQHTGVVVLLGLLASMAGVLLAATMLLREVSLLLLAATLPVAAAARLVPGIGAWLPSVLRWVAALVLWKPAAALIYAAGHHLMTPDEPRSLLVGVVTLGLAVAALPTLARWLAPAAQTMSRGLLGGGGVERVPGGAHLVARGPTMQQHVARIERDFGSPAGHRLPPPGGGRRVVSPVGARTATARHPTHAPGDPAGEAREDVRVGAGGDDPGEASADGPHPTARLWADNGNGRHEGT